MVTVKKQNTEYKKPKSNTAHKKCLVFCPSWLLLSCDLPNNVRPMVYFFSFPLEWRAWSRFCQRQSPRKHRGKSPWWLTAASWRVRVTAAFAVSHWWSLLGIFTVRRNWSGKTGGHSRKPHLGLSRLGVYTAVHLESSGTTWKHRGKSHYWRFVTTFSPCRGSHWRPLLAIFTAIRAITSIILFTFIFFFNDVHVVHVVYVVIRCNLQLLPNQGSSHFCHFLITLFHYGFFMFFHFLVILL